MSRSSVPGRRSGTACRVIVSFNDTNGRWRRLSTPRREAERPRLGPIGPEQSPSGERRQRRRRSSLRRLSDVGGRRETPAQPRARGWSEARRNGRVSAVSVAPAAKLLCVLTASTFARRLLRRLTATRSRRRMNALGRSIHVRGKGCAHDHDRFAHRDPSSSFSLVRTQARERGSACPARPIRTPPSGSI
jgi:hypothetical protein